MMPSIRREWLLCTLAMLLPFLLGWNLKGCHIQSTSTLCAASTPSTTSTPHDASNISENEHTPVSSTPTSSPCTTETSPCLTKREPFDPLVPMHVQNRITELYNDLKRNGSVVNDVLHRKAPVIPNIFHFIRFNQNHMEFFEMLAIKSAILVANAEFVYIHCNQPPEGRFWEMISSEKRVKVIHREPPQNVFGKSFNWIQHAADLARIQVLREYGGIYLDNDCLVVNDQLHHLRQHKCVVGASHQEIYMANSILMGTKDCAFLALYEELYRLDYQPSQWYYNGGQLPHIALIEHFPGLVYVSEEGIRQDISQWLWELDMPVVEFQKRFRILHLYYRFKDRDHTDKASYDENNIKTTKNSFSRIARWLMFSHEDIGV